MVRTKSMVLLCLALSALGGSSAFADDSRLENTTFNQYRKLQDQPAQTKDALTPTEVSELYRKTITNPVSSLDVVGKYDPTGAIGFCFGRAMTAQLVARQMQLQASTASMAKLFIVGALCSGCKKADDAPEWRFHVTTLVKGVDKNWYAIDPIMYAGGAYKPLTARQWIASVRNGWDTFNGPKVQAKLYLVPATTVMPDLRKLTDPETGDKIIELNFVPEQHGLATSAAALERFGLSRRSGESIYELSEKDADRYFQTTEEAAGDRFEFLQAKINDDVLPYHGYFVELFGGLLGARR